MSLPESGLSSYRYAVRLGYLQSAVLEQLTLRVTSTEDRPTSCSAVYSIAMWVSSWSVNKGLWPTTSNPIRRATKHLLSVPPPPHPTTIKTTTIAFKRSNNTLYLYLTARSLQFPIFLIFDLNFLFFILLLVQGFCQLGSYRLPPTRTLLHRLKSSARRKQEL
jgi:hypothetical protein